MSWHFLFIFFIVLTSSFGKEQPDLIAQCPEGCQNISKQTSCGSLSNVLFCSMELNGDVTMGCLDGNIYKLTPNGCSTTRSADNTQIYQRIAFRFITLFGELYAHLNFPTRATPPYFVLASGIELIVGFWLFTFATKWKKTSFSLSGAIIGFIYGLTITCAWTLSTPLNWLNGIGIVLLPAFLTIASILFDRVAQVCCGASFGFLLAIATLAEVYGRTNRSLDSVVFYTPLISSAFFGVCGAIFSDLGLVLFSATCSSFALTSAAIQLIFSHFEPNCISLASWLSQCRNVEIEICFGAIFLLVFIIQLACLRRTKRKRDDIPLLDSNDVHRSLNNYGGTAFEREVVCRYSQQQLEELFLACSPGGHKEGLYPVYFTRGDTPKCATCGKVFPEHHIGERSPCFSDERQPTYHV